MNFKNPRICIYANRWFAKFAAKERASDATIADAVHRAEAGLIDADLRSGLSSSASRVRVEASRAAIARS